MKRSEDEEKENDDKETNEELKKFFGKCRDGKIRAMKIAIENEQLSLVNYKEKKGSWESDYEKFVPGLVEAAQPTFILFRLDTKSETTAYDWLLISWSPDDSPVRQKMLYASTKATLKQEFGSGQISEELHATVEVSLSGLPSLVPSQNARYHLFNFKHTHEGDVLESIVFIYSMPGDCCSVKEKMLYSSCKAPLLETITSSIGLQVEKRLEIDSGSELTEDYLQDELHPKKCLHRPKFDKPKGPPNRGARRITKDEKSRHCSIS
ncbi:hypothetical protein LSTR_LSTR010505 [Laodelphax striatellus]|uniref:ADF-H domain-containing protein n=1 Tax=Laodelphax striatellus TaxID=195883 RepID=A0A482WRD1_LAOST|nr:hypothetical protein LSTR_LSTR010505 [Laodelphax striatellus]